MRKEDLVKDGKFSRAAIMKRAWAYVKSPFCTQYRKDFKGALHAAWVDAKLVMDELLFEKEREGKPLFPEKGLKMSDLYWSQNMRLGYVCR